MASSLLVSSVGCALLDHDCGIAVVVVVDRDGWTISKMMGISA
jgi:hypothetical protein